MKILSSICFAAIIIFQLRNYLWFYMMGRFERSIWACNPILVLTVIGLSLLILLGTWVVSLFLRKNRLWTTVVFLCAIAFTGPLWMLLPPGSLVVYGLRNHIMELWTLDDLRRFTHEVEQEMPGIIVHENESDYVIKRRGDAYDKLREKYSFMKWGIGGKGNPNISERDDALNVMWGGALFGSLGFSISIWGKRIDPHPDPETKVLRMSDDIYFYYGE